MKVGKKKNTHGVWFLWFLWQNFKCCLVVAERAAKVAEQQDRDRTHHQMSPRAGTPVGALMGVVPPPTPMGILNSSMTPVSGNPS